MRAESRAFQSGRSRQFRSLHATERRDLSHRLRGARRRAVRLDARHGKIAPDLLRLGGLRSVYGLVSKYFRDERLRTVFSFHPLLIGGSPFRASCDLLPDHLPGEALRRAFRHGRHGSLVKGLVESDRRAGRRNSLRRRGQDDRGRERPGDRRGARLGRAHHGRILSSPTPTPPGLTGISFRASARKRWTDRKIDRSRYSMGLFVWYFGVNRRYDDVAHHTILLGPRYRDFATDIFDRKTLADDFSLYLHRPTATDPSLAPPGLRYVLRALAGAESGGRPGLARRGRTLSPQNRAMLEKSVASRPFSCHRHARS